MVGLQEGDALGAMEKLCRQLTYHLSPHSLEAAWTVGKRHRPAALQPTGNGRDERRIADEAGGGMKTISPLPKD